MDTIEITWTVDDVLEVAPDLNMEQCRQVLARAIDLHDANIGINWEVLEWHASEVRATV